MKSSFLYSIIFILASVLVILFLALPQYQKWAAIRKKVDVLKEELKNEEEYFNQLSLMKRKLEEKKTEVEKLNTALPNNCSFAELFNFIQTLSSQTRFLFSEISSLSLSPLPDAPFLEMSANIKIVGEYQDLKNFLKGLEQSSRLIEVKKIDFSTPEKGPLSIELTISAKCYGD